MLQTHVPMPDAGPPVTSHGAQGSPVAHLAYGAPAHHSLQAPASSMQHQHLKPRPASAQVSLSVSPTHSRDAAWDVFRALQRTGGICSEFLTVISQN